MTANFQANGFPVLIGSLPLDDHEEAMRLVVQHTPEIPQWVQLPKLQQEGMIAQFAPGLPGLLTENDRLFVDTGQANYEEDLVRFYEDYMEVVDGKTDLFDSRFVLKEDAARGFFVLMKYLESLSASPMAVKAQITGPFSFGTGIPDQNKRAVFYDPQIRDVFVKLLAMKAKWQVRQLSNFGWPIIIFLDEPALAGVGSSEFTSVSNEEIGECLEEVIAAVHSEGGFAGVHVCANTDWSLVLASAADIVSFDAYSYFDRFILYADQIRKYIESGRILAWGIVPTFEAEIIDKETTASLVKQWREKAGQLEALGFDSATMLLQSLITPSCGMGSLSIELATKVLRLTREVSEIIRTQ